MNFVPRTFYYLLFAFYILLCAQLHALEFGQNKVISKTFDWKVYISTHFDIYHYGPSEIIPELAQYAEQVYDEVTSDMGFFEMERTPLFIYSSFHDFYMTNISEVGEGTGGFSELFKYRLVIPLNGSRNWFEKVFRHEFTHIYQFNYFYNGFWRSIRYAKFIFYPLWFLEGMSEIQAGPEDAAYDRMILRDAVMHDYLIPVERLYGFSHLQYKKGYLAYKESEALLNFLTAEYGRNTVREMMEGLKNSFSYESVLYGVTGLDVLTLNRRFVEHLREESGYGEIDDGREAAEISEKLIGAAGYNRRARVSADGSKIYFLSDPDWYVDLYMYDRKTKKKVSLIGRSFLSKLDGISSSPFFLSEDGGEILFAGHKDSLFHIYRYDIKRKRLKSLYSGGYDEILSPVRINNNEIAFIGLKSCRTDIYLLDEKTGSIRRITDSAGYENELFYSKKNNKLFFTGENIRKTEIYAVDLKSGEVSPVISRQADCRNPFYDDRSDTLYFISPSEEKAYNLFARGFPGGEAEQVTALRSGVFSPAADYSTAGGILFSLFENEGMSIRKLAGQYPVSVPLNTAKSGAEIPRLRFAEPPLPLFAKRGIGELEGDVISGETSEHKSAVSERSVEISGFPVRNYRTRFTTDLVFPALYFSSSDGFAGLLYWQLSDMPGDNSMLFYGAGMSASNYTDITFQYSFKKYNPGINLQYKYTTDTSALGLDIYDRFSSDAGLSVSWPLSRYSRLDLGLLTRDRFYRPKDAGVKDLRATDNSFSVSAVYDSSFSKFLFTSGGSRLNLTWSKGVPVLNGNYDYDEKKAEYQKFIRISDRLVLASRSALYFSLGRDRSVFSPGGFFYPNYFALRGIENPAWSGYSAFMQTAEARILAFDEINYYMWYMFPDFLFKSVELHLFADYVSYGLVPERNDYAYGASLHINTFILQLYWLLLRFDFAYNPTKQKNYFYISFSPSF